MAAVARIVERLSGIPAAQWDALHGGRNPFVSHAFLAGLEQHGCVRAEWGWAPRHRTLWDGDELIAAAPAYAKHNSHGEFVFDHAWAHAYARHGLDYFPKTLCAVPYSPVTGPRLLARTPAARERLLQAVVESAAQDGHSSAHVNFHEAGEHDAFGADWLARLDIQYHWHNDAGWRDFQDFLEALDHKHRKNIRQERSRVARERVEVRVVEGAQATPADLDAMHRFYVGTFAEYGNSPALTPGFFRHLADAMPESLVLFIAERDGRPIAGALCLRGGDTLYGRYWGADERVPALHFEACYYQGIEYCLRHGLTRFEPGAQGEHKIARGFLPRFVHSHHWIASPEFRAALRGWCKQESAVVRRHAASLAARTPFRHGGGDAVAPDAATG